MGLTATGFELALNELTDATTGINKIAVDLDLDGITASQTITFDAAVGGTGSGTVVSNVILTFSCPAGAHVERLVLYNGTTILGYADLASATDSNAFDYVVDSLTITLT